MRVLYVCAIMSVYLVICFHHEVKHKMSGHLLYSMTLVVVSFAYPVKLNILTRNVGFTKILRKKLYYYFI